MDNLHKVASAHTLAVRELILRYIIFQLDPTQIRVSWLYGKVGKVSHNDNYQFLIKEVRLMPYHFHPHHIVFKNTWQNISIK